MNKAFCFFCCTFLFLGIYGTLNAQTTIEQYHEQHQAFLANKSERNVKIGQLDDSLRELKGSPEAILHLEKDIDSLRKVKKELDEQKAQLSGNNAATVANNNNIEEYNLFIEECICRFANGRLGLKYDKENVDKAIQYFGSVKDETLRKRFAEVPKLLSRYAEDYDEFIGVINEAQKDVDRANQLADESYRKKYISRLKNLRYYKDFFIPTENKWKGWRIYYLSDEIDKAISLLERHNLKSNTPYKVDFQYLLIEE